MRNVLVASWIVFYKFLSVKVLLHASFILSLTVCAYVYTCVEVFMLIHVIFG